MVLRVAQSWAVLPFALLSAAAQSQILGNLTTTTIWSTVRSTSTIITDSCSRPSLPFCNAIQWPALSSSLSFVADTTTSSSTSTNQSLTSSTLSARPIQTTYPGQQFKIRVSIPGKYFFLRIGVNIGVVDVVEPSGNEQTFFVDSEGYLHYYNDPTQILYFPPFAVSGFQKARQQRSSMAIFKYKNKEDLNDTDVATRFEVFTNWLRLTIQGTIANFYIILRNETSVAARGLSRRQNFVRGLYIAEDESNLPPGFQKATVTPVIPPRTSPSVSTPLSTPITSSFSSGSGSGSGSITPSSSSSLSSSSSDTSFPSSSTTQEPDAYNIILAQSLFTFCSSLLDYSVGTTLFLSGGVTTSTTVIDFTSSETTTTISTVISSSISATTSISYEVTYRRNKRALETPTALVNFPGMTLTSACSKAVSAPTFTGTSTSFFPPTKTIFSTSSSPVSTEISVSVDFSTSLEVGASTTTIEASVGTGHLAIPPSDAASSPTAWLRCSDNGNGFRGYGTGKYLIYEKDIEECRDSFVDNQFLYVRLSQSTRLSVVQTPTNPRNSGKGFLLCARSDSVAGFTRPWFYTTNYRNGGQIRDFKIDPNGSLGRETLFAWCEYPEYTTSDGIVIQAGSYLNLAPNNTVKPDDATSCSYHDHLYWQEFNP